MAISKVHFDLFKQLPLPKGGSVLQLGEANLYGDFDPGFRIDDPYKAAKHLYHELFAPSKIVSIDMDGPTSLKLDLNKPVQFQEQFDLIVNHGTVEHLFDVANGFRICHDACKVDGLMVHESPFTGWIDHGFYNLQPTLFWDLAAVNGYEIVLFAAEHLKTQSHLVFKTREQLLSLADKLPPNLMLFVCFRKKTDDEFKIPMQGVYNKTVSREVQDAWLKLR